MCSILRFSDAGVVLVVIFIAVNCVSSQREGLINSAVKRIANWPVFKPVLSLTRSVCYSELSKVMLEEAD